MIKFKSYGLERSQFVYRMQKSDQMVLKGVNWCKQYKNQVIWSWKESICYRMQKSGQMVLKGVSLSTLGTQCKNQFIWSWKESIVYTMTKLGQMVLKGDNCLHNDKIWSNGLERSQLGTQW